MSNQEMVLFLLDFEKAYHCIEWSFLEGTMAAMGFSPTWIKWVRALYVDAHSSVSVNGVTSDSFKISMYV